MPLVNIMLGEVIFGGVGAGMYGILVFIVAIPIAMSSPYPAPKDHEWVIQTSSYQLASAPPPVAPQKSSMRVASLVQVPVAIETEPLPLPEPDEDITTESLGLLASTGAAPRDSSPPPAPRRSPAAAPPPPPVGSPAAPPPKPRSVMEDVDQYLWEVYQRAPIKKDGTGDFTWKDPAAAKRMGKAMPAYVIGGMDPDFREQLYHAGRAMDAAGLQWSMLSAFRDDYRQTLASGFKARTGNSLHGGSRATGGYGHGRAADVVNISGDNSAVWRWIDRNGAKYGLLRPMPGADPAHIQPRGAWHNIAIAMRENRVGPSEDKRGVKTAAIKSKTSAR